MFWQFYSATKSKDTFYEDSTSRIDLPKQQSLRWDAEPEVLWGDIDVVTEPVVSGSSRTSAGVMALSGESIA